MKEPFTVNLKKDAEGNFVIPGNLKVNGHVGVRRDPHPKVGVIVNGTGLNKAVETVNGRYGVYSNGEIAGNEITGNEVKAKDVIGTNRVGFNNGRYAIYLENNNEINQYNHGKLGVLHLGYRAPVHLGYRGDPVYINRVKVNSKLIGGTGSSDMEAIRNLSELANNLTKNGKLVVPGGLEIKGNLKVNGHVGIRRDPHSKVGLIVNGTGLINAVETVNGTYGFYSNKTLGVAGSIRLQTNGDISGRHIHGYSINAAKGGLNAYSNLYVRGDSRLDGNLRVNNEVKATDVIGTRKVGFNNGRYAIYLQNNNEINQYSNGKPGVLHIGYRGGPTHIGYRGAPVYINKKIPIKNEDDIHIRRRNGWRYLNYTQRNISSDKPGNYAGWAYWSSGYDGDADFFIQKKR